MAYAWAAGAGVMLTAAFVGLLSTGFAQTDLIGIFTGCAWRCGGGVVYQPDGPVCAAYAF